MSANCHECLVVGFANIGPCVVAGLQRSLIMSSQYTCMYTDVHCILLLQVEACVYMCIYFHTSLRIHMRLHVCMFSYVQIPFASPSIDMHL